MTEVQIISCVNCPKRKEWRNCNEEDTCSNGRRYHSRKIKPGDAMILALRDDGAELKVIIKNKEI